MTASKTFNRAFAAAACILAGAGIAQAQINPFGREYSRFSEEDLHLMRVEADKLLSTGKVGSVASWNSEKSGNFGTMELERIFSAKGLPCRQLDHVVKFKGERDARRFQLTYCRVGNEWRLAQ